MNQPHRVVILGGGFGGLAAAQGLKNVPVQVTLIDRRNFHLFQPLLYQVATGWLSPANITSTLRAILKRQQNARVLLGEAESIDTGRGQVALSGGAEIGYDTLIVATGSRAFYFGNENWQAIAPGLKTVEDATAIRSRIFLAFEAAEQKGNPAIIQELLTFAIVGGGPTASSWPARWARSLTIPCAMIFVASTRQRRAFSFLKAASVYSPRILPDSRPKQSLPWKNWESPSGPKR